MYLLLTYDYRNKIIFPHINGVDLIAMFDLSSLCCNVKQSNMTILLLQKPLGRYFMILKTIIKGIRIFLEEAVYLR